MTLAASTSPTAETPSVKPAVLTRRAGAPWPHATALRTLVIGALGVVFGDIGTSPLYAIKECIDEHHGVAATHQNVLGVLSLVVWSLMMVVTVKYLTFIMKADNGGEGGILALLALVPPKKKLRLDPHRLDRRAGDLRRCPSLRRRRHHTRDLRLLARSKDSRSPPPLSSPESSRSPASFSWASSWCRRGARPASAQIFGPIMVAWFATLAVLGIASDRRATRRCSRRSTRFTRSASSSSTAGTAFLVLGAVVLVITGGEALYADMGHFGRRPIRIAWFVFVMPALLLNYFGQGALVLENPKAASNPFFAMVPGPLIYPMVLLATLATVIASQALISGAYSLTRQAIQLGFFPRVTIVHTSGEAEGQIYIPEINAALAVACIWLVLSFQESSALAAAYGIAVTGTMSITSVIYYVVLTRDLALAASGRPAALVGVFLVFDLAFFGANLLKFFHGGWFPIGGGDAHLLDDDHLEERSRPSRPQPRREAPPVARFPRRSRRTASRLA